MSYYYDLSLVMASAELNAYTDSNVTATQQLTTVGDGFMGESMSGDTVNDMATDAKQVEDGVSAINDVLGATGDSASGGEGGDMSAETGSSSGENGSGSGSNDGNGYDGSDGFAGGNGGQGY